MVRDRFIDGQAKCALRRHLDCFGPDTPMRDIVDSCHVWESHNEAAVRRNGGSDRNSPQVVYQVTEDSPSPAVSTELETLDEVIFLRTESCSFSACWGKYGHPSQSYRSGLS